MESNVLIVDDSPLICEIVCRVLSDFNFNFMRAHSAAQAVDIIRGKHMPDLILLDIILPDMNGYDLCRVIKQNPLTASIPILFITSFCDANSVVNGFEAGAVDYITKPFNRHELRARVLAHLQNKIMADNMRVLNETLSSALLENRRLATEDPLTKLYNRRHAYESISRRFHSNSVYGVGIIIADVDDFKLINDSYGHIAGDYVLCKIATILKEEAGKKGIVCRWGGEEFLIALTGSAALDVAKLGEKICRRVNDTSFCFKKSKMRCSITAGAAYGEKGESFETTLANADAALYEGKETGKNVCVAYDS